jgi:hypothetical protein
MRGFALRSRHLPGITPVSLSPSQACCQEPQLSDDGTPFYPLASSFSVSGFTVAPRFLASEVSLELLRQQATAVCSEPVWINDRRVCSQLAGILDTANGMLNDGDRGGAASAVEDFRKTVEDLRLSEAVDPNAYWLLSVNSSHVSRTLQER